MIKKIILFMILCVSSFAFKISSTNFDKEMGIGESKSEVYTIYNKKNYPLRYKASIEKNPTNIKVEPKNILIPANSSKDIEVSVVGDKVGEQRYFLLLEEEALNLENSGTQAKLKMKYRIEHKYRVK